MDIQSHVYKAQIPYFSDHFRCITWDPRDNGKSDRTADPSQYGNGHYVADALAVMDATDTKSAILVGFSLSGKGWVEDDLIPKGWTHCQREADQPDDVEGVLSDDADRKAFREHQERIAKRFFKTLDKEFGRHG